MEKILVSACLLGRPVRYNGSARTVHSDYLEVWRQQGRIVMLCPEIAAGLPTPRAPAEIEAGANGDDVLSSGARIWTRDGDDMTTEFRSGAEIALETARKHGCRFALLTDGSPSCGSTFIYAGNFDGTRRPGRGVVAALLSQNGVAVFAESQIGDLAEALESAG